MSTEELENEYLQNEKEIARLNQRNTEIVVELNKLFHNITVGDIVIYRGSEYKVDRVHLKGWEIYNRTRKPWVNGVVRKKDKSWGTRSVYLYSDWEKKV